MPINSIDLSLPTVRVAEHWTSLKDGRIKCQLCHRHCTLRPNQQGMCRSRVAMNGKLHVITYGNLSTLEVKPIENTPFYHFYPGSLTLAVGSWFCNLACVWCQNHEITRTNPPKTSEDIMYVGPSALVRMALNKGVGGILFSYNEPSVSLFEYSRDVIPLAKEKGLFTAYVTNGYFSLEALEELVELGLDAVHVDLKGCAPRINPFIGGKIESIWKFVEHAWTLGLHVEISTLIIPELTDEPPCIESIARRISQDLSPDVPLHVLKYYPFFRADLFGLTTPTPDDVVLRQAEMAKKFLHYVYVNNLANLTPYDHTWCPRCQTLLIARNKITVSRSHFKENETSCPKCGEHIPIVGTITTHDPHGRRQPEWEDSSREDRFWMLKTRSPKHSTT